MAIYTVHQAKPQLSKLTEQAERGEDVVISRGNNPRLSNATRELISDPSVDVSTLVQCRRRHDGKRRDPRARGGNVLVITAAHRSATTRSHSAG